jgi:glycine oxidase
VRADILIVGQGVAGTLLGWALERAGMAFEISDAGSTDTASRAAAGLINPITGRRLVKSWRVDQWLPLARQSYAMIEMELGRKVWTDFRIRRLFADDRERAVFATKFAAGEFGPFVRAGADADGFWIEEAARVDFATLIDASRERWRRAGKLRGGTDDIAQAQLDHALVIDCTGCVAAKSDTFAFVPWEFSRGQALEISVSDLVPDVALNRRHSVVPIGPNRAWFGATHEPGVTSTASTVVAVASLETSARQILGRPCATEAVRVGIRVNLPDKRPVIGRHPERPRLGLINGLGAKGALLAPALAQEWASHLTTNRSFDPQLAVDRFLSSENQ